MKKNTSKKLSKRLAQYGALTLAIAGVSDASGQIQYTDVDPDETLTGTRFMLDLNGDATVDYEISNDGVFSGVTPGTTARVYTSNSSSILGVNAGGNYNYPFALDEGSPIDELEATWITAPNYQTLNWMGCAYTSSQWCDGQVDKYLGLRITVGADQHYGWIRMDMPADASTITIKDYAINLTPGEGLEAGEGETLGISNSNIEGFSYFVDANNNLNLRAANQLTAVSIYNINGQKVIDSSLSSSNEKVNLQGLSTGMYIARVNVGDLATTIKITKK